MILIEGFDGENSEDCYDNHDRFSWLLNSLENMGYDVFILDFNDARNDIRTNANSLIELLKLLNNSPYVNGVYYQSGKKGNHQITVIGTSMGGLIARYALTKMESKATELGLNPLNPHNVSLFISYDTPHQGAVIPYGLQVMYDDIMNSSALAIGLKAIPRIKEYYKALKSKAARQMLVNYYNTGPAPDFYEFRNELVSLGNYPQKC